MSKATLIEFWRDLILSDDAMTRYTADRQDAIARYELTEDESRSLVQDDYAAMYRRGVPLELMFQGILLAGIHPRDYFAALHQGLGYTGRGVVLAGSAAAAEGNWTPSN